MADTPVISIFSSVDYPVLRTSDVLSGIAYGGLYHGVFKKHKLGTVVSETVAQTLGSSIGRAVDINDDRLGVEKLEGRNPLMKSTSTGISTALIDYGMGRKGNMLERIVGSAVIDGASTWLATNYLLNEDQRIL